MIEAPVEPIKVLLVEDNPADIELTIESFEASRFNINLNFVTNGEDAMDYIYRRGKFESASRPDMILLDLNLPGMSGREIIAEIKSDNALRPIPIVVLTSSEAEDDIIKSYDLGANCYVKKPVSFGTFQNIIRSLEDFWFTVVKLPRSNR